MVNPSDLPYRELTDDNCLDVMTEVLQQIEQQYRDQVGKTAEDGVPPMKPVIRVHQGDEEKFLDMLTRNILMTPVENPPMPGMLMIGTLRGIPIYVYPQVPKDEVLIISFGPQKLYRFKMVTK